MNTDGSYASNAVPVALGVEKGPDLLIDFCE